MEEATADTLDETDWAMNLELCDMINHDRINSLELIRSRCEEKDYDEGS